MAVTHLGSKTVGAVNPGVQTLALPALLQYLADLASRLAMLGDQLSAYADASVSFTNPLDVLAALEETIALLAAQIADIATGILPTIGTASADCNAQLGGLKLQLDALDTLVKQLEAAASTGGVHAFSVDSTPGNVGAELGSLIGGGMPDGGPPTARIRGVLLLTEAPAAYAALGSLIAVA